MNRTILTRLSVAALTAATLACNLSTPVRPTPAAASGGGSSGDSTLKVSAPSPHSPGNGATLQEPVNTGIELSAGAAAATFGAPVSLRYEFQLMGPDGSVIETAIVNGPSWKQTSALEYATRYTWRLRAVQDDASGPWSPTFAFTTADLPPEFRCRPPFMSDPISIMYCHIDLLHDFEEPDERVLWLKRVARDFNIAGVPGGPFGVLWKRAGNNCEGYSCDIICSGQGNDQRQYDILINDVVPIWGGHGATVHDGIRVDFCEVQ